MKVKLAMWRECKVSGWVLSIWFDLEVSKSNWIDCLESTGIWFHCVNCFQNDCVRKLYICATKIFHLKNTLQNVHFPFQTEVRSVRSMINRSNLIFFMVHCKEKSSPKVLRIFSWEFVFRQLQFLRMLLCIIEVIPDSGTKVAYLHKIQLWCKVNRFDVKLCILPPIYCASSVDKKSLKWRRF